MKNTVVSRGGIHFERPQQFSHCHLLGIGANLHDITLNMKNKKSNHSELTAQRRETYAFKFPWFELFYFWVVKRNNSGKLKMRYLQKRQSWNSFMLSGRTGKLVHCSLSTSHLYCVISLDLPTQTGSIDLRKAGLHVRSINTSQRWALISYDLVKTPTTKSSELQLPADYVQRDS